MSKRFVIRVVLAVGLLFGMVFGSPLLAEEHAGEWASSAEPGWAGGPKAEPVRSAGATFGQIPLYFIENQGQVDGQVAYYVQGKDKTLYFAPGEVTFVLDGEDSARWVLKLDFLGANRDVQPVGQDETGAVISYFKGRPAEWKTGLGTYSRIVYPDLWPGIDLEYLGTVNQLKYQFVVHPGADPCQIQLAYRGADVSINETGQLEVATPAGGFHDGVPYAHQVIDDEEHEVALSYEFAGTSGLLQAASDSSEAFGDPLVYGFHVGDYDRTRPLVLDPAILVYCGYIGGSGSDRAWDVAVDGEGSAYVTGETMSVQSSFPVTVGPDLTYNGDTDAFVAKVSADGMGLVYCGYIGGSDYDAGWGIEVDGDGSAYVTGYTESNQAEGFPATVGPDLTYNGGQDAFVAKVGRDGTVLEYCGYIGGSGDERSVDIAVDGDGRAYVTGQTESDQTTFPVIVGPDLSFNGTGGWRGDAFVARVVSGGSGLDYCGYIGGSGDDFAHGLAVDANGSAYVVGATESGEATFPVTVGPDTTHNGYFDAFVAKVMADGAGLAYCGYIGGEKGEALGDVAVDGEGNAYVVGSTHSSEALGFPVLVGPDLIHGGGVQGVDGFVAKLTSDGTALVYCGYIGGAEDDWGHDIDLDSEGNPHVAGLTESSESQGFPVAIGPDRTYNGGRDAYVAKVSATGRRLVYCGYVGGSGAENGTGIAVDAEDNAYLAGSTASGEATFPAIVGPDLDYNGGDVDAFLAKVSTVNHEPTVGTVVPASGSGSAGVATAFITSWSDADAWEDLKQCYFHIGHGQSLKNEVVLLYHAQNNKLYMRSDDGKDWLGGFAPGSANILENSQAQVDCSLTIAQGSADTLVVAWAITFKPAFAGTQKTYLKTADISGAMSARVKIGTWTIE